MGQLAQALDLPVHPMCRDLHERRGQKGRRDHLTLMGLDLLDQSTPMDPDRQGQTVVRALLAVALSSCLTRMFRKLVASATE